MAENKKTEAGFTRGQLAASKRFNRNRDVLNAVLAAYPADEKFTAEAAEEMIENYLKGKVK